MAQTIGFEGTGQYCFLNRDAAPPNDELFIIGACDRGFAGSKTLYVQQVTYRKSELPFLF